MNESQRDKPLENSCERLISATHFGLDMSEGEGSTSALDGESVDELFSALADGQARATVCYLHASDDGVASVQELANHVVETRSVDDPDQVEIRLHHVILPRLRDLGCVDYDVRTRTVRYWNCRGVSRLLRTVHE
jgi:hypothetical protein